MPVRPGRGVQVIDRLGVTSSCSGHDAISACWPRGRQVAPLISTAARTLSKEGL